MEHIVLCCHVLDIGSDKDLQEHTSASTVYQASTCATDY